MRPLDGSLPCPFQGCFSLENHKRNPEGDGDRCLKRRTAENGKIISPWKIASKPTPRHGGVEGVQLVARCDGCWGCCWCEYKDGDGTSIGPWKGESVSKGDIPQTGPFSQWGSLGANRKSSTLKRRQKIQEQHLRD